MTDFRVIDRDELWRTITEKYDLCIDIAVSKSLSPETFDREQALTHMAGAAFLEELRVRLMADTKHAPSIPQGYSYSFEHGWVQDQEDESDAQVHADPSP